MHLSNVELTERDARSLQHLAACEYCRNRKRQLEKLRTLVIDSTTSVDLQPSRNVWMKLEQRVTSNNNSTKEYRFQLSSLFKQPSLSIAIVAVLGLTNIIIRYSEKSKSEVLVTQLIEENSYIQEQLNYKHVVVAEYSYTNLNFQNRLKQIDRELHIAYTKNAPIDEKIALWKERKRILNRLLFPRQNKRLLTI